MSRLTAFPLLISVAVIACSPQSAQDNHGFVKLAPNAGIKFAAAMIDGRVQIDAGCVGLTGSDGVFRPFILYSDLDVSRSAGADFVRLGDQVAKVGEHISAVGQVVVIDDVRDLSEFVTPRSCGREGVLIQRFVKAAGEMP